MPLFDGNAIAAALERAGAPAGATKAFIVSGETGPAGGLKAAYVQKVAHGWAVDVELEIAYTGTVRARGGVVWSG